MMSKLENQTSFLITLLQNSACVWVQALGQTVEAVVQLVQEGYVVLSLPGAANAVAFASAMDYNLQSTEAPPRFAVGQTVTATVAALPDPASGEKRRWCQFGSFVLHRALVLLAYTTFICIQRQHPVV